MRTGFLERFGTAVVVATIVASGCGRPAPVRARPAGDSLGVVAPATPSAVASAVALAAGAQGPDPLASLREWENATRSGTDFAHPRSSERGFGADPYVVVPLASRPSVDARSGVGASGAAFAGILRGRSAIVLLDEGLRERDRAPTPESPTGLAVARDGELFVVGELAGRVARYRSAGDRLVATGSIELPDVRAMRDVTTGPEGLVYAVEEHDGRLIALAPGPPGAAAPPEARADTPLCHGPLHVLRAGPSLLVDCLLDHTIVIRAVDERGFPVVAGEARIVHDGPMWGMDALSDGDGLLVAVGGVEDHPLDRTEGSFGFVDSFVTLYRVAGSRVSKLSEVNVSEHGVVTPKSLRLWRGMARPGGVGGPLHLAVAGYATARLAVVTWNAVAAWPADPVGPSAVDVTALPPGSAMMDRLADGSFVLANPLLDAWVRARPAGATVVPVPDAAAAPRTSDSKLGEALFFTTLMAPWDRSDGRLSRFTCETCHFEGYVDGRTHHTGRGDVMATTKPLLGLFNNRPHFSRALDPDLTAMVHNEFRVAGAKSDHDPWFALDVDDYPWLSGLGLPEPTLSPVDLRRALMQFFMDFNHRPNPAVVGRTRWTELERAGAEVFRDRCERCHQARLVADEPSTRLAFADWEEHVMAREGAIVWARAEYEKTGVLPYVNERGARVVSLRRLYKKHPYFTNGSAGSLGAVLERARFTEADFFHDGAPPGGAELGAREKEALAAFLDLL